MRSVKKWIGWVLLAAIALVAVNDGGRHIVALYKVDESSRELMAKAIQVTQQPGVTSAWPAVEQLAREQGVEVVTYEQTASGISLSVRVWVYGTWVSGPAYDYFNKLPRSQPYPVERTVVSTP